MNPGRFVIKGTLVFVASAMAAYGFAELVLAHDEVLPKNATSANYLHDGDEPIVGVLLTQEQVHGISETLASHEQRIADLESTIEILEQDNQKGEEQ